MNRGALPGFSRPAKRDRRVNSLPCGFSTLFSSLTIFSPRITTASGNVTAGIYLTVIEVKGRGCLKALMLVSTNGTPKTMTLRLTLDGTVLHDGPTPAISNTSAFALVGSIAFGTLSSLLDDALDFDQSMLIEYTSSVSEIDGANISYRYELHK